MNLNFITDLFHFSSSLAPTALHYVPSWLPSPGVLYSIAGLLVVGVVLAIVLVKSIRLAVEFGLGAAVIGTFAWLTMGYVNMGENRIIPERNQLAAQVKQDADRADSFRADASALSDQLAKAVAAKRPIIIKRTTQTNEAIHAQPEAVRTIVIPHAVGELLNSPLDSAAGDANPAAAGAAAAQGAAAADVPRVSCADTTLEAWEVWSTTVRGQYEQLASDYNALYGYADGLYRASVRANAVGSP